jgi:hypothetical protein
MRTRDGGRLYAIHELGLLHLTFARHVSVEIPGERTGFKIGRSRSFSQFDGFRRHNRAAVPAARISKLGHAANMPRLPW